MKKEYVVHENGALPLLLTGKDVELSETDWYRNTVSFVRGATSAHIRLPFDYGGYDEILNHLIPRIVIDTPDLDQLQYGWETLEGLEEDTLAKKTLVACSEYDEELSERYLKQWIMESFKVLFDGARDTVESYDPDVWYISGVNVSLSPVNTLLCFEMVSKEQ